MADEITISASMSMSNGNLNVTAQVPNYQADQTTAKYAKGTQTTGFAAHEALDLGDLTTPGYIVVRNNDATNFIEVGVDDAGVFVPVIKVRPGESAGPLYVADGATLYVQADTADVEMERTIFAA